MATMQIIFRGSLKEKQASAYRDWEIKNRAALQSHAPKGWTYAGTYFTVFGIGKYDTENRWDISSYAALDAARNHEDETWDKLNLEATEFFEPTISGETSLMRGADDVKILG